MDRNVLRRLLQGSTVSAIYGLVFYRRGVLCDVPEEVWIKTDGTCGVRIYGEADGEGIACDTSFPSPVDMQADGAFILADLSCERPWISLCAGRVEQVALIVARASDKAIGLGLLTAEGGLYILNLGDQLRAFDAVPGDILREENAEVLVLEDDNPKE